MKVTTIGVGSNLIRLLGERDLAEKVRIRVARSGMVALSFRIVISCKIGVLSISSGLVGGIGCGMRRFANVGMSGVGVFIRNIEIVSWKKAVITIGAVGARLLRGVFLTKTTGLRTGGRFVGRLGMFPIPSNSAKAGVALAVLSTTGRMGTLRGPSVITVTGTVSSNSLHKTENGSKIVLSRLLHNFAGRVERRGRVSAVALTGTYRHTATATCGTIVGPGRKAVLAMTGKTSRGTTRLTRAARSLSAFVSRIVGCTRRILRGAPRVLPMLGRTNMMSSNKRKLLRIVHNTCSTFRKGRVSCSTVRTDTNAGVIGPSRRTRARVGFKCYARFVVVLRGRFATGSRARFGTCLRSVKSSVMYMTSSSVIGVRIRAGSPKLTVRGTLACKRLSHVGVSGVERRRRRELVGSTRGLTTRRTRTGGTRPHGRIKFVTISVKRKVGRVFHRLNTSCVVRNNRAVGPDARSVLGTVSRIGTRRVFVLPGGGGVVLTTGRTRALARSGSVVIIPSGAIPRKVATVVGCVPSTSTRAGLRTVVRKVKGIGAKRIACTIHSARVSSGRVRRKSVVKVKSDKVLTIKRSIRRAAGRVLTRLISRSARLVDLCCNRSMRRRDTRGFTRRVRSLCPSMSISMRSNKRPVCCCMLSIRWKRLWMGERGDDAMLGSKASQSV